MKMTKTMVESLLLLPLLTGKYLAHSVLAVSGS